LVFSNPRIEMEKSMKQAFIDFFFFFRNNTPQICIFFLSKLARAAVSSKTPRRAQSEGRPACQWAKRVFSKRRDSFHT
jgi:hypothetical protein